MAPVDGAVLVSLTVGAAGGAERVAFDALVLAGGAGRRLGGADKPALRVGGVRLLDRVLDAAHEATTVVVVGPERPVGRPVLWTREEPPGAGPVAAIAAGLHLVGSALVLVLAADLALLDRATVGLLVTAASNPGADGALLVDDDGAEQLLAGAWRTPALRAALARLDSPDGVPVRRLLDGLVRTRVPAPGTVWLDCDTPQDVRRAEELL